MLEITTNKNPCRIELRIFENFIEIKDNSGGISSDITEKDIFKIGNNENGNKSGIGMKKSFCTLGNKIYIFSNRKDCSRKFSMDLNVKGEELISESEKIDYNPNIEEGTVIYISSLDNKVNKEILSLECENKIIRDLGRRYSKFINKRKLMIKVNNNYVKSVDINGKKIKSCTLLEKYNVNLFKGSKESPGIDIFINDYMIYKRVKSKEARWTFLNEAKHTYSDCIVEINYYGDKNIFEDEKDKLFKSVIDFIKDNKIHFQSKTITIQYEMPIGKVEELKDYYGEDTAKGIGIKAFDKLYEDYTWNRTKK